MNYLSLLIEFDINCWWFISFSKALRVDYLYCLLVVIRWRDTSKWERSRWKHRLMNTVKRINKHIFSGASTFLIRRRVRLNKLIKIEKRGESFRGINCWLVKERFIGNSQKIDCAKRMKRVLWEISTLLIIKKSKLVAVTDF